MVAYIDEHKEEFGVGAALLEGRFRGGWMSCWGRCGAGAAAGCRRLVA